MAFPGCLVERLFEETRMGLALILAMTLTFTASHAGYYTGNSMLQNCRTDKPSSWDISLVPSTLRKRRDLQWLA